MIKWRPISTARFIRDDTHALLRMPNARIYYAVWGPRGRVWAWWPQPGQSAKHSIGLYSPVEWCPITYDKTVFTAASIEALA